MSKSFGQNRRQNPRIDKEYCIKFLVKGDPQQKHDMCQIRDISKGGLRFNSSFPILKNTILCIDLLVPYVDEATALEATVVDCHEKVPRLLYEVRVKFVDVNPMTRDVLDIIEKRYHKGA